jgi:predicted N-acetyltransferase YhbS
LSFDEVYHVHASGCIVFHKSAYFEMFEFNTAWRTNSFSAAEG